MDFGARQKQPSERPGFVLGADEETLWKVKRLFAGTCAHPSAPGRAQQTSHSALLGTLLLGKQPPERSSSGWELPGGCAAAAMLRCRAALRCGAERCRAARAPADPLPLRDSGDSDSPFFGQQYTTSNRPDQLAQPI